ncbi:MAG: bifunctional hydroxymethylpyrimidine kinase/phosphomethylpyrimidine kinase, partial [Verrucomicrobia bacterium]|nr:bifunctional hydroxymethylpyrimidine kinase/phosphomethylpyrimidine kinase [Verrucomicrobiota bacterium]
KEVERSRAGEGGGSGVGKKMESAVLVKGGHLMLAKAEDYLAWPNGKLKTFTALRCKGVETHGTGCTYSAAICAGLAKGLSLEKAVGIGKKFITRAIWRHLKLGRYTPLNHLQA